MPKIEPYNPFTNRFPYTILDTPPVTPTRFAPEPIHAILKLIDKSVSVETSFNMNITYETLSKIVAAINDDPIYQKDNKMVSPLIVDVEEYNATGKVSFVDPKIKPFGRKINL